MIHKVEFRNEELCHHVNKTQEIQDTSRQDEYDCLMLSLSSQQARSDTPSGLATRDIRPTGPQGNHQSPLWLLENALHSQKRPEAEGHMTQSGAVYQQEAKLAKEEQAGTAMVSMMAQAAYPKHRQKYSP